MNKENVLVKPMSDIDYLQFRITDLINSKYNIETTIINVNRLFEDYKTKESTDKKLRGIGL